MSPSNSLGRMRCRLGQLHVLWRVSFLAVVLLAPSPASTQTSQWRALPDAPMALGSRHDGLWFVDAATGWICNLDGEVWRTTDGGYQWTRTVNQPEAFRSIAFLDRDRGFLGSLFDINLLFETSDGGTTWQVVGNIPQPRPAGVCGLWAVGGRVIYGCGRYTGPATMLKSDDRGATWRAIDLSAYANSLIDCYFSSPDSGFVVGGVDPFPNLVRGTVLWTGDGGDTWQVRWSGNVTGEWGWKISFPTSEVGYVSLERDSGPNRFLKTEDGGKTWNVLPFGSGPAFYEQGIGFATPTLGWLGGGDTAARETTNGGVTWSPANWGVRLDRIFMLREDLGYAVGEQVWKYSLDAVPSATPPPVLARPVELAQNSPNPFNPTTVIPYYVREGGHVRLVVYDPRGQFMATLVDDLRPFGEHRVVWDGRDALGNEVPSGVYFYRLETRSFSEVRKMTVIR